MTKEEFLHEINAGRYPKYILSQIKEGKPEKDCSSIVCTSSNNIVLAKYENGKWHQAHFRTATFVYPSQSIYYTSIKEDVIYWTKGEAKDITRKQLSD